MNRQSPCFGFFGISEKGKVSPMKNEKIPERKIVTKDGFAAWFDNFWYHYKWLTIGVVFSVVVLTVCLLQTCTKEEQDIVMVYAGPTYLSVSENDQLEQVFEDLMPYDYDKNGEHCALVSVYEIYSEEQIRAYNATAPEGAAIDTNRNSSQYSTYSTYMQTGESAVYFLDPWLYESISKDYLMPLGDVLSGIPDGAMDAYSVRLGDTKLYEEQAALRLLPADTRICLMRPLVWGENRNEKAYGFAKELFAAIVNDQGE